MPAVKAVKSDRQVVSAFLYTLDEASYNRAKKDGGGRLEIPGQFSASGNYGDFVEQRNSTYRNEQKYGSERDAKRIWERGLPADAIKAWKDVKLACINRSGIKVAAVQKDATSVTVVFSWVPPPGAVKRGVVKRSSLKGGSMSGTIAGRALPDGYSFDVNSSEVIEYKRVPGEPFVISLNVNGFPGYISLPATAAPAQDTRSEIVGKWVGDWEYLSETTGTSRLTYRITSPPGAKDRLVVAVSGLGDRPIDLWLEATYKNRTLTYSNSSGVISLLQTENMLSGVMKRHDGNILASIRMIKAGKN